MSIYIDSDAFIRWEKGEFDLPAWLLNRGDETVLIPTTVWQQLNYGTFFWVQSRAAKRAKFLTLIGEIAEVAPFTKAHAERAAEIAATLRTSEIGFADSQIAAMALLDDAELLTFNHAHFSRVAGLKLAAM
jgi:predicted nucleic acid-binding protein